MYSMWKRTIVEGKTIERGFVLYIIQIMCQKYYFFVIDFNFFRGRKWREYMMIGANSLIISFDTTIYD